MLEFRETGSQTLTQGQVTEFLREMRSSAKTTNPRVLGLHMRAQIIAKNNGYPKMLYHPLLDPVEVRNEDEEMALIDRGFREGYIPKQYPQYLFRRNMDPRFAARVEPGTGVTLSHAFIEERLVKNEAEKASLIEAKTPKGQFPWHESIDDVEPIPEDDSEDLALQLARAEGELTARRETDKDSKKK